MLESWHTHKFVLSMYTIIYFSPTGNAQHLAKLLATQLGASHENIHPLEFLDPDQIEANKHLILLYPVHGFNAPRIVKRFAKVLAPGLFDHVSLIGVGFTTNWMNGAVSSELRKSFRKNGYDIVVDEILAMPLTFIMSFPDDLNLKLIAESEQRISALSKAIFELQISENKVAGKSHVMNFVGKIESPAARLFGLELYANSQCNSCGACWQNCPAKNIKQKKNAKPGFGFSCLMCMRCIYNCPQ